MYRKSSEMAPSFMSLWIEYRYYPDRCDWFNQLCLLIECVDIAWVLTAASQFI